MKVPLLDLKAQYAEIRDEVRAVIDEVCDSQNFILGVKVEAFERHIAEYCGVEHSIGVSSGTDALLIALMALEIGPGDAVITSPYTFFGTAGSITRCGATPVFADIDLDDLCLSPESTEKHISTKTRAILPVHLFGAAVKMDDFVELSSKYNIPILEDCAQAHGTEYNGR